MRKALPANGLTGPHGRGHGRQRSEATPSGFRVEGFRDLVMGWSLIMLTSRPQAPLRMKCLTCIHNKPHYIAEIPAPGRLFVEVATCDGMLSLTRLERPEGSRMLLLK